MLAEGWEGFRLSSAVHASKELVIPEQLATEGQAQWVLGSGTSLWLHVDCALLQYGKWKTKNKTTSLPGSCPQLLSLDKLQWALSNG